ncbi:MAG: BTAD domain-containing putative transcriptional regulator [Gemmatimonadaceae bacterium]
MTELRLFGAIELTGPGGQELRSVLTQPKRLALLVYLAVASPRGFHRRDTLVALFWPDHDETHARAALSRAVYHIRGAVGEGVLVSRGNEELSLATDRIRCDVSAFEDALAADRPEEALALYRGDLLAGFYLSGAPEFERWLDEERTRLRRGAAVATWALAESRERSGDAVGAAEWGARAAAFSPVDEMVLRRQLGLLERLGDRTAAVRAYETFARRLEQEYELAPSPQTRAVVARLRAGADKRTGITLPGAPLPSNHAAVAPLTAGPSTEVTVDRASEPDSALAAAPRPVRRAAWSPRYRLAAWLGFGTLVALLGIGSWQLVAGARQDRLPRTRERVVVADFVSPTMDSTLGDVVAHVLRSELAQSPALSVVGGEAIEAALRRMRREPGTRLTSGLAREVAAREEVKLVVDGDVRAAGIGLALTASVVEVATGDIIGGASAIARDSTEVLAAIERLAGSIRQAVGESIASVRTGDSLYSFTTSSLPALRNHMAGSRALWRGDYRTAAELFERAVALDPAFAHADLMLMQSLRAGGFPRGRVLRPLVRAYELRDRLTERERYAVEGVYHLNVTGDLPEAIAAFRKHIEALRQLPVAEAGFYASLGNALQLSGDLASAGAVLREARVRHPSPATLTALISVLHAEGSDAEARGVLDELSRRYPEHPQALTMRVRLLADSGRYDDAHALASRIRRTDEVRTDLELQAELDAIRGRLGEAAGHLTEQRDHALARGDLAAALSVATALGRLRLLAGDSARALREVDRLLAGHPIRSLDVLSRPILPLALFYARAGQPRRARAWLAAYERDEPPIFRGPDRWMLHRVRATLDAAEGRPQQALAELREAALAPALQVGQFDDPHLAIGDHPELARMYETLGAPDSAIAVYERYLAAHSLDRMVADAFELGPALERLGRLYESRGDSARSAVHYRRFAELWHGADPAIRARAEAARRRAAAMQHASARAAISPH